MSMKHRTHANIFCSARLTVATLDASVVLENNFASQATMKAARAFHDALEVFFMSHLDCYDVAVA